MSDYYEDDKSQYMKWLLDNGYGHLCFGCRKRIEAGLMITVEMVGPLPTYWHTACRFEEDEVQEIFDEGVDKDIKYVKRTHKYEY